MGRFVFCLINMKRFLAILGLIFILFSLIGTVYVALFSNNNNLLFFFIFLDVVIPACIYAYILISKYINKK